MIRTGYSFHTAVGHLPDVLARLKDCGWRDAPMADRASTFGFVKWTKLATAAGLRPVYGVELGVTPELGQKKPILDFWTFLATDSLVPLHELIYKATANPGAEPSLTYAQALHTPGLIKISGERLLLQHLPAQLEDFYVGLSPATSRGLYNAVKRAGLQFCAMNNNYYPCHKDKEFYRVTLGGRANTQTYPQYILSDEEWWAAVHVDDDTKADALQNRPLILNRCQATLQKAMMLRPERPMPLRDMCVAGATQFGVDLTDQVYSDRLDRELSIIEEKKFEDYFYIVADMVQWARQRMIVGPGRGSSGGSLVCYLLGITSIDPLKHGLLFERFLDITRTELPDVDIDFSDVKRDLVFAYAEEKYGRQRVARLGTVGMFKPRSALNQAGKTLRIPQWKINKVLDNIIIRSSGDSRANQQLEDTLQDTETGRGLLTEHPEIRISSRMEAHPSNASQHAAGILITDQDVTNFVAINAHTGGAHCDKKDAEELNLLKIDALGLTQLSVFERTMELIGERPVSGWLEKIPLDDKAAFDVLNKGHFAGVFQFNGRSLRNLVKQSGVNSFDDMNSITALSRPGPMGSGGAASWAKRKAGTEEITYPHEMLKPYLEDTLGIVFYQETVMRIVRELGDLTWRDVTALRKAMSKSLGTEYFDQYGDKWKAKVIAKGMPEKIANSFWVDLCKFGLYGFNRWHSVAYSFVSYWCCWFKAHHPLEFAAATLDAARPVEQLELLRELAAEGIDYVPLDPERSADKWMPMHEGNRTYLLGPLTNIHGIGPEAVSEILAARRRNEPLRETLANKLTNAKTHLDSLYPVRDYIAGLNMEAAKIVTTPMPVSEVQCGRFGRYEEVLIIAVVNKINPKDLNEAINVEKRKRWGGGVFTDGMTKSLGMFFKDDLDEIYASIDREDYARMAPEIIERGKVGRSVYAVKGTVPRNFRMITINRIKYLGDLNEDINVVERLRLTLAPEHGGTTQGGEIVDP